MENKCQKKELDKKNSNKKATKRAKYNNGRELTVV